MATGTLPYVLIATTVRPSERPDKLIKLGRLALLLRSALIKGGSRARTAHAAASRVVDPERSILCAARAGTGPWRPPPRRARRRFLASASGRGPFRIAVRSRSPSCVLGSLWSARDRSSGP